MMLGSLPQFSLPDLEQADNPGSIVKFIRQYSKYKELTAEEIAAMLPIKLWIDDCDGWCRNYCDGGIDK
ncbi:MAG: hypothetical protein IKQ91_09935 [Oscillospiraceae bacterium]|nr:hypothetical protein [Oscillospiraceae bacterium]